MVQKYTILKVLIHNSSKSYNSRQGFTLIELIVGLLIMVIVTGLAMNSFLQASTSFNKDKRNIESNQNLSAVLEIIGNDIKQAGEGINDVNFPVIEFSRDPDSTANTAANALNPQASSRIIIRRSVSPALTLCQNILANAALPTTMIVADTVSTNTNCKFTAAAPTLFPPSSVTTAPFSTLISTREYRCQLDQLNAEYLSTTSELCGTASSTGTEVLRAAISDGNGRIRTFNYYDDNFNATTSPVQYYINTSMTAGDPTDTARNKSIPYSAASGLPIYLIEERVYALDNNGNLTLTINGGTSQTLIKKISQFNISARLYTNTTDRIVNPTPTVPATTPAAGATPATTTISSSDFICPTGSNQPAAAAATLANPQYICQFNYNNLGSDVPMNWKQLAGVRVSLQAKYDGTGQSSTASDTDKAKLQAIAEYFPRNVLSK
jgi:prepilin-type N-terminal cleavage/methylation domain-containing protein